MKDEHLMVALRQALRRYGSAELPIDAADDAVHRSVRQRRPEPARSRRPGWISVGEIEACQSPNSYPRRSRRAIKTRCLDLTREADGPVKEVRTLGLRTWVRVAFADAASQPAPSDAATAGEAGLPTPLRSDLDDPVPEDTP